MAGWPTIDFETENIHYGAKIKEDGNLMHRMITKTVSFSKNATNIFFHILTQCNLKCRHCYINPAQHGENRLPPETIEKWLRALTSRPQEANLVLLGGEPTLHPDLSRVIKTSRKMGFGSITVDTNGYLFHDILSKVTPEEVDFFSFSLDGPTDHVNDPIRGKGSYRQCLSGIEAAAAAGFQTSLIYTVSRMNIQALEGFPELIKRLAVSRVFIQVIGLRGNSGNIKADEMQVSMEEWRNTVPRIAERIARQGIKVTYPKVYLHPDEPFECAGKVARNYFVFPNGRVYQCPLCEDHPLHSFVFEGDVLKETPKINESDLFELNIPEGCVINKLIQPGNIPTSPEGRPECRIACCLLKEEISIAG